MIDCVQKNGGYLENYRNYVNTITPTEEKRIGVRFHTSFHGIFRFLGKDPKGTLLDILITVGEADTVPIIQLLKRPLRATKTKLDSDIPTSDKVRETKSTT